MPHDVDALLSEIQTLRRKLEFFQRHHQCCSIAPPASPPLDDDTKASADLKIIPFTFQAIEPSKPRDTIPRWRQIADQILRDVPVPAQWVERKEDLGLDTIQGTAQLTAAILGAPVQIFRQMETSPLSAGVILSAQAYATDTKATQKKANTFCQIHSFMELVLSSLCAVLEILDYPVDEINKTMRICLSDSEDINLKRLRRGALWVNGTIVDMCGAGIGDKGSELFFIYGVSTSKYSNLADNTDSRPHFIKSFLEKGFKNLQDDPRQAVPTFTPLLIPAYIKVLVGDGITLSQICDALGYGEKFVTESTARLCEQYRDLALKGDSGSVAIPLPASMKRKRSSNTTSSATKRKRSSNNPPSVERRTNGNVQSSQEVDKAIVFQCQQFQTGLDCESGDAFGVEGNDDSHFTPPRSVEADSYCPSPEGAGCGSNPDNVTCSAEPSTSQANIHSDNEQHISRIDMLIAAATDPCRGHTRSTDLVHTEEHQHSLLQDKEPEIQRDAGVNNSPQIAAERLEVEKHLWASVPPVDRMGWESMFAPLDVDSMGWESMFAPLEVDSMGWEDMLTGLPEVDGTGYKLLSGGRIELYEWEIQANNAREIPVLQ